MSTEEDMPQRKRDRFKAFAKRSAPVPLPVRTSDLPKRAASAVVMLAVAGTALWLGGVPWMIFVAVVALGVLWEWWRLVWAFAPGAMARAAWMLGGLVYVGIGAGMLAEIRTIDAGLVLMIVGVVIGVDVGAYFAGRAIGGPKIAPRISPSKTWAGLAGGALGASALLTFFMQGLPAINCWYFSQQPVNQFAFDGPCTYLRLSFDIPFVLELLLIGTVIAVIAQAGDFFESWMKRQAGVKDSSNLIPGHGGLFDRVDGLLAVCFVLGILELVDWTI